MSDTHFSGPVISENGFSTGTAGRSSSVISVTAGHTLTASDHGKTVLLADTAAGDITLPAVTNTGFKIRIICATSVVTASVIISAEGDNINSSLVVDGTAVQGASEDFITFVGTGAALAGDWVELISNGVTWLGTGIGFGTGSITTTDPS